MLHVSANKGPTFSVSELIWSQSSWSCLCVGEPPVEAAANPGGSRVRCLLLSMESWWHLPDRLWTWRLLWAVALECSGNISTCFRPSPHIIIILYLWYLLTDHVSMYQPRFSWEILHKSIGRWCQRLELSNSNSVNKRGKKNMPSASYGYSVGCVYSMTSPFSSPPLSFIHPSPTLT